MRVLPADAAIRWEIGFDLASQARPGFVRERERAEAALGLNGRMKMPDDHDTAGRLLHTTCRRAKSRPARAVKSCSENSRIASSTASRITTTAASLVQRSHLPCAAKLERLKISSADVSQVESLIA